MKMHRIRANEKFKLAESFCRNFVFLTRKVAYDKTFSTAKFARNESGQKRAARPQKFLFVHTCSFCLNKLLYKRKLL